MYINLIHILSKSWNFCWDIGLTLVRRLCWYHVSWSQIMQDQIPDHTEKLVMMFYVRGYAIRWALNGTTPTLAPLLSPSVLTPSNLLNKKYDISNSVNMSGRASVAPNTWPTSRSARQRVGSILVPTPKQGGVVNRGQSSNNHLTY